ELEDVVGDAGQLRPRKSQTPWSRTRGDEESLGLELAPIDGESVRRHETGRAADELDVVLAQRLLRRRRYRVGEGLLASENLGPVDPIDADFDPVLAGPADFV